MESRLRHPDACGLAERQHRCRAARAALSTRERRLRAPGFRARKIEALPLDDDRGRRARGNPASPGGALLCLARRAPRLKVTKSVRECPVAVRRSRTDKRTTPTLSAQSRYSPAKTRFFARFQPWHTPCNP